MKKAFEFFWKQQDDIPTGMGYPLFGAAHLLSVASTFILMLFLILFILRLKNNKQRQFLKKLPIFMLGMEAFKDRFHGWLHSWEILDIFWGMQD